MQELAQASQATAEGQASQSEGRESGLAPIPTSSAASQPRSDFAAQTVETSVEPAADSRAVAAHRAVARPKGAARGRPARRAVVDPRAVAAPRVSPVEAAALGPEGAAAGLRTVSSEKVEEAGAVSKVPSVHVSPEPASVRLRSVGRPARGRTPRLGPTSGSAADAPLPLADGDLPLFARTRTPNGKAVPKVRT